MNRLMFNKKNFEAERDFVFFTHRYIEEVKDGKKVRVRVDDPHDAHISMVDNGYVITIKDKKYWKELKKTGLRGKGARMIYDIQDAAGVSSRYCHLYLDVKHHSVIMDEME